MEENQSNQNQPEQKQNPSGQSPLGGATPSISPIDQTPPVSPVLKSKPKFPLIVIIGIVLFLLVAGGVAGFYIFKPQLMSLISKPTPTPSPIITITPTTDPTANWKTYTNNKRGYTLKYPNSYVLSEQEKDQTLLEVTSLERNNSQINQVGVVIGANINFTIFDTGKDSYKNAISQFDTKDIVKTTLGGKDAFLINLKYNPQASQYEKIFIPLDYGFLEVGFESGFEDTTSNQDIYFAEFNQILPTFQFTN